MHLDGRLASNGSAACSCSVVEFAKNLAAHWHYKQNKFFRYTLMIKMHRITTLSQPHCGLAISRSNCRHANVCCSFSPNFGDQFSRNSSGTSQTPKLFIPGQEGSGPRQGGGSLILPSTPGEGKTTAGADAGSMPVRQNFRPPPGFMDNSGDGISTKEMSTDEMLRCLQAQSGHWYELATYLPKLQREGIDGSIVEEMTGIDRRQQNVWSNASMVYGSLRKGGKVANLEYFDLAGTEYLLYELRFLSIDQRAKAANYIVEHELDPQESLVLARAIKEHERRKGEKEGFSDSPADCLAFKYYRDALENQGGDEMKTYIEKGLAVAETDAARETLVREFFLLLNSQIIAGSHEQTNAFCFLVAIAEFCR